MRFKQLGPPLTSQTNDQAAKNPTVHRLICHHPHIPPLTLGASCFASITSSQPSPASLLKERALRGMDGRKIGTLSESPQNTPGTFFPFARQGNWHVSACQWVGG